MKPDSSYVKRSTPLQPRSRHAHIFKRIKYENELELGFGQKIAKMAYGENLFSCIQCGTCSGTCPVSQYMDFTPRKIIMMVREGFSDDVLNSLTIWLCASCYACTVDCPKNIQITNVMYALKREAMARKIYPKRFPIPILSKEFFKMIHEYGRSSETRLVINMYLKTNPFAMMKMSKMGLRLMRVGRISFKQEKIVNRTDLKKMLDKIKQLNKEEKK
jgi:quinone-modifying oxidoreductase, subunit QmoC